MSGDMRVRNNLDGTVGTAKRLSDLDAHSSKSGDFTQERPVLGKSVFFTPEGAAQFDQHKKNGMQFEALTDPKDFFSRLMAPTQTCTGEVKP